MTGVRDVSRNPGIDLLRGISIVLVIMHHVALRIPLKRSVLATFLPKWFIGALVYNGYEAVFIFFVISGFLIATNTLVRWGSLGAIDVRSFYVRRASRILPCLVALVVTLSILHLVGVSDYVITHSNQSLPRAVVSAFGLHLNWYEGHTGYLPGSWDVLWSLSIEEVFYLAFPVVCLLMRRNWILAPVLSVLALSLPVSRAALDGNQIWQEKAYLPGMAAIATGVLAALIAARFRHTTRKLTFVFCAAGAFGIFAVLSFEGPIWKYLGNGTLLLLTCSSMCAVLGFHWLGDGFSRWALISTGWLRSFGRLSYEVYLTHMFVVFSLTRVFKRIGASFWWGFLWYLPAIVLSYVLGWLVSRYFSLPSEHAMRARLTRPRAEATTAAG